MSLAILGACDGQNHAPRQIAAAQATSADCREVPSGEPGDLLLARCLATTLARPSGPPQRSNPQVVLYLDRSASMQGFLDPNYPTKTPTDYRSVVDRLIVGTSPVAAYTFGTSVRPFIPSLAVLGNKDFYSDRDTELEEVLATISRDTNLTRTHLVVGDARRGSPDRANGQFVQMRALAERWIASGGTFVVGASMAPFTTVETDPSGCRRDAAVSEASQTCPLYVFAFVAPPDAESMTMTIADVFQNMFVWPLRPIRPTEIRIIPSRQTPGISVRTDWDHAADSTHIARMRGITSASNTETSVTLAAGDTASFIGRTDASVLRGMGRQLVVESKPLSSDALAQPWRAVNPQGSIVRAIDDSAPRLAFVTRGRDAPRSIIRVDLAGTGAPRWLPEFDAVQASDIVRTYALARLFEAFRDDAARGPSAFARYFFVVN